MPIISKCPIISTSTLETSITSIHHSAMQQSITQHCSSTYSKALQTK